MMAPNSLSSRKIAFNPKLLLDRRLLMATAGVIVAAVAVHYLTVVHVWLKQRREERQWVAVNNLTPERLVARCRAPLSDDTKDLYPIMEREMRYRSAGNGTVVFKFSRTAEQGSGWVFMSMQDASSGLAYETPVARIGVLSCLDSRK